MQQMVEQDQVSEILVRGAVWSMVGMVFGFLFVLFSALLEGSMGPALDLLLASTSAAAATALFYGSMRLTVLVANFTFIATLVYTWQGASRYGLEPLVSIGAGVGLAVGAAYGWKDMRSRVFCADAKVVAGVVTGASIGVLGMLLATLLPSVRSTWLMAALSPFAVLLYVRLAPWFISRCHKLLPATLDGALVGLGVGSVTGLMFLIMAASMDSQLLDACVLESFVRGVQADWGGTVVACALACFPVGAVRAAMRVPWYNM